MEPPNTHASLPAQLRFAGRTSALTPCDRLPECWVDARRYPRLREWGEGWRNHTSVPQNPGLSMGAGLGRREQGACRREKGFRTARAAASMRKQDDRLLESVPSLDNESLSQIRNGPGHSRMPSGLILFEDRPEFRGGCRPRGESWHGPIESGQHPFRRCHEISATDRCPQVCGPSNVTNRNAIHSTMAHPFRSARPYSGSALPCSARGNHAPKWQECHRFKKWILRVSGFHSSQFSSRFVVRWCNDLGHGVHGGIPGAGKEGKRRGGLDWTGLDVNPAHWPANWGFRLAQDHSATQSSPVPTSSRVLPLHCLVRRVPALQPSIPSPTSILLRSLALTPILDDPAQTNVETIDFRASLPRAGVSSAHRVFGRTRGVQV